MKIQAIIAEDESLAREHLRNFIAEVDWLECIGEAEDGAQALEQIDALRPDLIFLDVQMPELTGIEVLQRARHKPSVVFTTAFDHYAVTAFELEALDYLTKPFGRDRFRVTMERVRRHLLLPESQSNLADRLRTALEGSSRLDRFFVRRDDELVPMSVSDVIRIEAYGDYVYVHADGDRHLIHMNLSQFLMRLDPGQFVRVHRSHAVNLDHVRSIRPHDERRLRLLMSDGSNIVASRAGSMALKGYMA